MCILSPLWLSSPHFLQSFLGVMGRGSEGDARQALQETCWASTGTCLWPCHGCHPLQGSLTFLTLHRSILMQGGLKRPQTQQHKESREAVSALAQEEKGASVGPVTSVLHTGGQDYSLWCCTPTVWQAGCDKTQITLPSGTWPAKLSPTPCTFVAGSLLGTCVHSRQGL